ncbi:hypothetical protein ACT453_58410, partial [Bacillus sp. D-CC]
NIASLLTALDFKPYQLHDQNERTPIGGKIVFQRLPRFSRGSFLLFHRFIQHAIKFIHRAETVGIYRATA